jgi:uncharacterized protein YydD (DUF2326 family)
MITLKKFYLDPDVLQRGIFKPVVFQKGINLIIGDKSSEEFDESQQKKMNSVGKSLFIEFINFCLLKDYARSRVSRIPGSVLSSDTYACLEITYESKTALNEILIRRNVGGTLPMQIIVDGDVTEFEEKDKDLERAKEYLSHFFLTTEIEKKPSLRQLLSILIRNEKSGFDDILFPDTNSAGFSREDLIAPHAYLFGFDLEKIKLLASLRDQADTAQKNVTEAKKRIKNSGLKWQDVRSYIHQLEDEVQKLDYSVEQMRPAEGSSQVLTEIGELNKELDTLISEKTSREILARKIKSLGQTSEVLNPAELERVYEKYKKGLGNLVGKTLEETLNFRKQIDEFQNELMTNKLLVLNAEIDGISSEIELLDSKIANAYVKIGYGKTVSDFRVTLRQQQESNQKLESLRHDYELIEANDKEKKRLQSKRQQAIDEIQARLFEIQNYISDFEKDLMEMHRFIYGNVSCHFRIVVNERAKKQILEFDYRTDLDGGASSDRIKTLLYDVLLMLNKYTSRKHPGFLIHDNVFAAVGRNDMVNALNYLYQMERKGAEFQYIVAINRDEFDAHESELEFKASDKVVLELSRENTLLGAHYTELI